MLRGDKGSLEPIKEIFKRKAFWAVAIILLLVVFLFPPYIERSRQYGVKGRSWEWIFLSYNRWEIDLKTLLVEAVIAILVSMGFCLIPFRKIGILLGFMWSGIKESETNHKGTRASTYEWVCPKCNFINQMEGYKQEDICSKCGHLVELNIPGRVKESSKKEPED